MKSKALLENLGLKKHVTQIGEVKTQLWFETKENKKRIKIAAGVGGSVCLMGIIVTIIKKYINKKNPYAE